MLIHFLVQSAIQNKFVGASTLLRTNAKGRLKTQWAKIGTVANNQVFVRLAKPSMKPLLHETGKVLMGIESKFLEANDVSDQIKK